jgi:hypothetical protein
MYHINYRGFTLISLNKITGNIFEAAEYANFALIYLRFRYKENYFFFVAGFPISVQGLSIQNTEVQSTAS